jgi:hypothetical protein
MMMMIVLMTWCLFWRQITVLVLSRKGHKLPYIFKVNFIHLHLGLPNGVSPPGFPPPPKHSVFAPVRITLPARFLLDLIILIIFDKSLTSSLCSFPILLLRSLSGAQMSSWAPCGQKSSTSVLPVMWDSKLHTHTKRAYKIVTFISWGIFRCNLSGFQPPNNTASYPRRPDS